MIGSSDDDSLDRLQEFIDVITRLASGDFEARVKLSDRGNELDAIAAGLNMMAEEVSAKFVENERLVYTLEQNVIEMGAQHRTIVSLSTPSLMVWDGILVLPLIGVLDDARAEKLSRELLERIVRSRVDVVIIDVTGIAEMNASTAKHLLDTYTGIRLLGARGILTGLTSANARTMVTLDIDMQSVSLRGSLHDGLMLAFSMTGRRVQESKHGR